MVRRIRLAVALPVAALLVALAGCTGTDIPAGPVPPEDPREPVETSPESPGEDPESPGEQDPPDGEQPPDEFRPAIEHDDERVVAAGEDVAERVGAEREQVQVAEFRAVTWPDGSIGCPEEGVAYTQALVDGYLLVLEADGTQYRYHAAGEEDFAYCADPQEPLDGDGDES